MKGFKATYNMKCRDLTYEVGKTYSINKFKLCSHGFHFCQEMKDVINYYSYREDFILLEVEALGKTQSDDDKTVTDKLKVLRIVPKEEYTFGTPIYTYDDRNNKTSLTYPNGSKYTWTYDDRNNKISQTSPNGSKYTCTYDDRNNMISLTYPDGSKTTWTYDDRNNKTSETYSDGSKWEITIN